MWTYYDCKTPIDLLAYLLSYQCRDKFGHYHCRCAHECLLSCNFFSSICECSEAFGFNLDGFSWTQLDCRIFRSLTTDYSVQCPYISLLHYLSAPTSEGTEATTAFWGWMLADLEAYTRGNTRALNA